MDQFGKIKNLMELKSADFSNPNNFYPSNFNNHDEELSFLSRLGFATNPFNQKVDTLENVLKVFDKLNSDRQNLPYPIDGLVVKLTNNSISSKLGVVGKTPRAWCAMKFAAEEVTTRLLDVSWQVGRTGKITPVATLEDADLAGTVVKRATLHNFKEVLEKDLYHNDTLIIRKAGDIIPEVVQVLINLRKPVSNFPHPSFDNLGKVLPPKTCPSCKTTLEITSTGVDLSCPNSESCPAQVEGRLVYYCQRNMANIPGLSEKIVAKFIDLYNVHDVYDLYRLPWAEIKTVEGFGEKSVENLSKSVENSKTIQDYKFLAALGIDGIGPEVAKLICEKINEKLEQEKYDNK
jgi:DNA ligase (NAD+)